MRFSPVTPEFMTLERVQQASIVAGVSSTTFTGAAFGLVSLLHVFAIAGDTTRSGGLHARLCYTFLFYLLIVGRLQGAYVGITVGLVLTMWVGIGAQVYKPPVLGHIPPPMDTDQCPYRNVTISTTDSSVSTTHQPLSTDGLALGAGVVNR